MRKQTATNAQFVRLWNRARSGGLVPERRLDELTADARGQIAMWGRLGKTAIAWSGGKDSLVLEHVARGLVGQGVCAQTRVEFPEMSRWVEANLPEGVTIERRGLDLHFLRAWPERLFPTTTAGTGWWMQTNQRTGQELYCAKNGVRVLLLGRRAEDGNYVPRAGHEKKGVLIQNPLRDWTQADTLAYIARHAIELPPCYFWPNGWIEGTGPWPNRGTGKVPLRDRWREVFAIDAEVVYDAAAVLPPARQFLQAEGLI